MSELHDVTAVVTIGRNVNGCPMTDSAWQRFRFDLKMTIVEAGGTAFAEPDIWDHSGHYGEYGNEKEDTAFAAFTFNSDRMPVLRNKLANLANRWCQEAIGLIVQKEQGTLVFADERLGDIG